VFNNKIIFSALYCSNLVP